MTPLQIKHQIETATNMAERNGFELEVGHDIVIIARRDPYVMDTTVQSLPSFDAVIWYFKGYEQQAFERKELDRAKDAS